VPRSGYLVALGAVVLLYVLSRTPAGASAAADLVGGVMNSVRGLRNNNPGNVRWSSANNWTGQVGNDGFGYAVFDERENGLRAMAKVLASYFRQGYNTPRSITARYAPPSDSNPTETYGRNVAKWIGVGIDQAIDFRQLPELMRAMIRMELGTVAAALVTDAQILDGIRRANV
jgi:hypothetical protein